MGCTSSTPANSIQSVNRVTNIPQQKLQVTPAPQEDSAKMTNKTSSELLPKPKAPTSVPLGGSTTPIHPQATWAENGITVAGGNGLGYEINQLLAVWGLYVDDEQTVYVADEGSHRIVSWKSNATSGQVVAGENEGGSGAHQLSCPFGVIVDKETDSLIISDSGNKRVVRWPRRNGKSGETIISNIDCSGLTIDDTGSLYIAIGDMEEGEVRRYRRGESQGTVVAGGNGSGNRLDQLSMIRHVFVDQDHSVYVSDLTNGRVMKWVEGAKEGIVVAGGQGRGYGLTQLGTPEGVVVDQLGTVYVADNDRITRWPNGATQGSVIIGGNDPGEQSNQLHGAQGLSFDRQGNLYVVDYGNGRVQKFNIDFNG